VDGDPPVGAGMRLHFPVWHAPQNTYNRDAVTVVRVGLRQTGGGGKSAREPPK
jgi:hypothetical protein